MSTEVQLNSGIHYDHLVYIRLFEGCNLHCDHCFIPHNPKKMSLDDFAKVPGMVERFAKPGDRIHLQWHGGEPTALGASYLRMAIEAIESSDVDVEWSHGIQTNLFEYDDELKNLFLDKFDGQIGVSWDPVIRKTRKGSPETNEDYEKRFWSNFERLLSDGISPYLIMTGTKILFEQFRNPFDLFTFLEGKGVTHAHIERLTKTGYARESWDAIGITNRENSIWMARCARAYLAYCDQKRSTRQPLNLSPFDGHFIAMKSLLNGSSGGYGCHSGVCDTRFHTIDASGYKPGCTALTSEYDNRGHDHPETVRMINMVEAREERQLDCKTCKFRPICNSGCMAQPRMDGSGECAGGSLFFQALEPMIKK